LKHHPRIDARSENGLMDAVWGEIFPIIEDPVKSKVEAGRL
jgi:hypothetical protein